VRGLRVDEPNRAKARNAGIAAARSALAIFCDDDTLAPPHFVDAHLRAHAVQTDRAVSGPIVNVETTANLMPARPQHYSRAFFCTCSAGVSKEANEAAGGFDERYDLYGWEDTDLGVRLRARGLKRAFAWDAYIYHVKPERVRGWNERLALAKEKGEMAARFVRKSPSWPVKLATGAHPANFLRASLLYARPLRRGYERAVRLKSDALGGRAAARLAREALIDAAYVDALRAALRRPDD